MNIVAFDLSLTATGCALPGGHSTLTPPKGVIGLERLAWIRSRVCFLAELADLVIFEGLSFGSNDPSAQERAGLAFAIRLELWYNKTPFILVPPSQLKKFVTGKGNAEKSLVLREVFRLWGAEAANDNEADAIGLLYLGLAIVGEFQPRNEAQRDIVAKVRAANADALTQLEAVHT